MAGFLLVRRWLLSWHVEIYECDSLICPEHVLSWISLLRMGYSLSNHYISSQYQCCMLKSVLLIIYRARERSFFVCPTYLRSYLFQVKSAHRLRYYIRCKLDSLIVLTNHIKISLYWIVTNPISCHILSTFVSENILY